MAPVQQSLAPTAPGARVQALVAKMTEANTLKRKPQPEAGTQVPPTPKRQHAMVDEPTCSKCFNNTFYIFLQTCRRFAQRLSRRAALKLTNYKSIKSISLYNFRT